MVVGTFAFILFSSAVAVFYLHGNISYFVPMFCIVTFKPRLGILKSLVGKILDRTGFERVPLLLVQQMVSLRSLRSGFSVGSA